MNGLCDEGAGGHEHGHGGGGGDPATVSVGLSVVVLVGFLFFNGLGGDVDRIGKALARE